MKKYFQYYHRILKYAGINFKQLFYFIKYLPKFLIDYKNFKKFKKIDKIFPVLSEKEFTQLDKHLFQLDLLVAQEVFKRKPYKHLDIGSKVDGLVSHIASFRELDVLDIRFFDISYKKNINIITEDLLLVDTEKYKYDSISSVGCIAHVGLGRYGDKIDTEGDLKSLKKITEMLSENGYLYLAVPTGIEKIVFNSHRQYDPEKFKNLLNKYELEILNQFTFDKNAFLIENKFNKLYDEISYTLYICKK